MSGFNFETFPILETERLKLRRITPDDTQAWLAVWNHPEVLRYLIDFETTPDEAEVKSIVEWADDIFSRKTGIRWAITLKSDDIMIGSCGFHLYNKNNRWAEIGYELHHDHWRKGIMSEAVSELLRFCFDELQLHRVEANVTIGNDASAGLLRHLGFSLEGTWRDKVYSKDQFHNLWLFGLLEDELVNQDEENG
jgi:[ribosomal protein S5]-alanine N-acetyltransferase